MKSILCIPGKWKDRTELVASIAISSAHEYIFCWECFLLHLPRKLASVSEVEVCDLDE